MRCANHACSRKRSTHLIGRLVHGEGVVRENRWYCSRRCYRESVLGDYFTRKLNGSEIRSRTHPLTARSLGAALQRMGKVSRLQLEEAIEAKRSNGSMPLVHYLLKRGLINRHDILEALGRHHRVPVATVGMKDLSQDLISKIPGSVARLSGVVPLSYDKLKRKLSLIMKDPSDLTTILTIRRLLSCDVQAFQGDPSEIDRLLDRYYPEEDELEEFAAQGIPGRLATAM